MPLAEKHAYEDYLARRDSSDRKQRYAARGAVDPKKPEQSESDRNFYDLLEKVQKSSGTNSFKTRR